MLPGCPSRYRAGVHRSSSARLVLASGSPRRHLLLTLAGYEFDVVAPEVDESRRHRESPEDYVVRLAREKATAVAAQVTPDTRVLGLDTSVVLGERVYGKPADAADAAEMLLSLAGKTHTVYTGYALVEATAYAAGGEPLDKAGGYALQGEGRRFVEQVEGLRSTVIGMPLEHVVDLLVRHGILPTATADFD